MTEYANDFKDFDIILPGNSNPNDKGEVYTMCHICGPYRTHPEHRKEKKLAVNIQKGTWFCQHCGWTGGLTPAEFLRGKKIVDPSALNPLKEEQYSFFEKRHIGRQTVDWCGTKFSVQSIMQKGSDLYVTKNCISFVYRMKGMIRMIKYRDGKKNFKIAKDSTLIAWGVDNLRGSKEGLITEGEIDAYSYIEAGYKFSTSVPNGTTISEKEKKQFEENGKFLDDIHLNLSWLDNCYEYYEELETIYICTDDDPAGIKLRMELGRRLGFDRCRIVKYDSYEYVDTDGTKKKCKDANNVLVHFGPEAVLETLKNAQPFPINDVVTVMDIEGDINELYTKGIEKGKTTGYPVLDPHFNWSNGHLIIGTGFMNMGKSVFYLNLFVLHAKLYNSRWMIYSPENYPVKNIYSLLIEIYGGNTLDIKVPDRMDWAVFSNAKKFIHEHFEVVNRPDGYTAEDLRDLSKRMIKQRGINGFMLDPWNSLLPSRRVYRSDDKELEQELSAEQRFAINTNTNRIILAHPNTPLKDKSKIYPAPSYHEIKGGDIWGNKGYEVMCIHQIHDPDDSTKIISEIHVQKVKNHKETGIPTYNSPVRMKFVRRSNRFIQEDGYDPFAENQDVQMALPLDLTF